MIKITIYFILLFSTYAIAEQSVFGAGDLNSPTPYGLTPVEEVIVENKKITINNEKRIKKVDTQISQLENKVDGLGSIFEGETRKLNDLSIEFKKQLSQLDFVKQKSDSSKDQLESLTQEFNSLKDQMELNTKNIELLKNSFDKIVALTNTINKEYVSKEEFNKLLAMLDKKETTTAKKKQAKPTQPFSGKSNSELMEEARELFKKDYFTKAIPILEHLIGVPHRPAECNYYMGEINYYRKNYEEALHYFKTSMMLYDKADYLPKLLLHSAISFENLGDKQNANSFYNTIVDVYPESPEAAEASKKIK